MAGRGYQRVEELTILQGALRIALDFREKASILRDGSLRRLPPTRICRVLKERRGVGSFRHPSASATAKKQPTAARQNTCKQLGARGPYPCALQLMGQS